MITKVQGKTLAGELAASQEPKLTALERAMLKWAVVDPDDKFVRLTVFDKRGNRATTSAYFVEDLVKEE